MVTASVISRLSQAPAAEGRLGHGGPQYDPVWRRPLASVSWWPKPPRGAWRSDQNALKVTELIEVKPMGRKRKNAEVPSTDKAEVLPRARHVAPLRKPADVTLERKRLYRAVINGRVPVDEAAKLNYILTGIRADLEADQPPQIEQTIHGPCVTSVVIHGVPSGTFLPQEEIDRLNSQFIAQPPAHITGPPMLKLFDGEADQDPEPPSAA